METHSRGDALQVDMAKRKKTRPVHEKPPVDAQHRAMLERRRSNATGPHPLDRDKGTRAVRERQAIQEQVNDSYMPGLGGTFEGLPG